MNEFLLCHILVIIKFSSFGAKLIVSCPESATVSAASGELAIYLQHAAFNAVFNVPFLRACKSKMLLFAVAVGLCAM